MKMLLNICKNTNLTEKKYAYLHSGEWNGCLHSLDILDLFPALSEGLLRPGGMSGNGTFIYIKKGIEYRQR